MFKFVVLCAFVATAAAEPKPDLLFSTPLVQPYAAYSTVISPAATSISSQTSSVIHPSPISYSAPLAFSHFIKKRSAQLLATPTFNPYSSYFPYSSIPSPLVSATPIVQSPIVYSGAHLPVEAHLIKKRSAQLLTTPYITPTTYLSNPTFSTHVITTPYLQNPYFGASVPVVNTHFIKKRSAEPSAQTFLPSTFLTPNNYFDSVPISPYLTSPLLYSNPPIIPAYSTSGIPLATTHLIKKRSAEPVAEPAPEPSADPQLLAQWPGYPTTYISGSPLISTYPATTFIKSAPVITPNPFVYSTFIKK